ncbi:B2 protein-like [Impatiens glandulifera]|uniref:B2 protein-like n=1 Tax=Impatiens glandulifera TaxID=253017 RepID=UPI001FB05E6D|nr:B2 protein-like [Impatiens glandulifera]
MEGMHSLWELGNEHRSQVKASEDHKWLMAASSLAEQTRSKCERMNNLDLSKGLAEIRSNKIGYQDNENIKNMYFNMLNLEAKAMESINKSSFQNGSFNLNASIYQKSNANISAGKYSVNNLSKELNNNTSDFTSGNNTLDKRFKTLPTAETLPRNEVLGGYIFVCNNDTMQEDLKHQLFGLPPRYRDSVRAITPGLPLFLYNYTAHQLHGIFEATSFGGSNIDPTAWEDKKFKGESRFPAQVKIRIRKICKPLEEDAFRPVLHHYDGPKFRLELSVPETLDLLDLCEQAGV